jgi:hypothetical protein
MNQIHIAVRVNSKRASQNLCLETLTSSANSVSSLPSGAYYRRSQVAQPQVIASRGALMLPI